MRWSALIPLAMSIIAFVLSLLVILAGYEKGFMEDYHIVAVSHGPPQLPSSSVTAESRDSYTSKSKAN